LVIIILLAIDRLLAISVILTAIQSSPKVDTRPLDLNVGSLVATQRLDYDEAVLKPLHEAQAVKAEKDRLAAIEAARQAEIARQAALKHAAMMKLAISPRVASFSYGGTLIAGTMGYSLPWGNCVNVAKAFGKNQPGNPISWRPTTHQPFIGAAALFYFNHVAVVTGILSDGSVEVAQQNSPGAPHRYSQNQIRGYF